MQAVEAAGLEKVYARTFRPGHTALAGVNLTVPRGSIFGLIGVNGAGKTTFIKAVVAVVRPTRGRLTVLGGSPEEERIRARIGYLPERSHHPPQATATEHLGSIARLKGLRPTDRDLARLLERVGLTASPKQKLASFSKGMKQRLGLAAALLGAPELLLLDEPTDGIDPLGRMEVRRILVEERARGATILLNSHLLAETERIADRVAILHGGRVLREGPLSELSRLGAAWRLRFAPGHDAAALQALGLTQTAPDTFTSEVEDPVLLNQLVDRARAGGALLIELSRGGQSLEQLLERLVAPEAA